MPIWIWMDARRIEPKRCIGSAIALQARIVALVTMAAEMLEQEHEIGLRIDRDLHELLFEMDDRCFAFWPRAIHLREARGWTTRQITRCVRVLVDVREDDVR